MKKKENNQKGEYIIYYDGACPFCYRYRTYLDLKKEYDLELRNARDYQKEIKQLNSQGYNINTGIIILHKQDIYQGFPAILHMQQLLWGTKRHVSPLLLGLGNLCYHIINSIRKIILFIKKIPSLDPNKT